MNSSCKYKDKTKMGRVSPEYQKQRTAAIKAGTWKPRHFETGESAFRDLWRRYILSAKNRGHLWELSELEVRKLFAGYCFYCDTPPSFVWPSPSIKSLKGSFLYNGIDRTDNATGYIKRNCVSCCKLCNLMKQKLTQEEFLRQVALIYRKASNVRPIECS
jgi:hypothetical protein